MKTQGLNILLVLIVLMLVNCAGTLKPSTNEAVSLKKASSGPPQWFTSPVLEDDSFIYSVAKGKARSEELAVNEAKRVCKIELSQRVTSNVQSQIKGFFLEAEMTETDSIVEFYQSTSQTIARNTLNTLSVIQEISHETSGSYLTAYVQLGIRKNVINTQIVNAVKNEKVLYDGLMNSKPFQELDSRVGIIQ